MPKPFTQWTVLPHGKLTRLDDNLLSVTGELHMPVGDFPRRMTVVRLHDGRLVVFSAIALDEAEMQALEAFGAPSYLVVPNDLHRMDAKIWKDRYPEMRVVAPAGVRKQVDEIVPVEDSEPHFGDPQVQFVTVPGTREREAALVVRTWSGTTLIVNDLIWNMNDRPGFGGWLFHVMGFTGKEPRIPGIVELREIKDKLALRAQLERWARIPNLNRIIVSHGEIVSRDAKSVLDRLAASLAA
ncbi:MAG TPA: hypothetical protein VER12_17810 [Polyangiaceae bacterium]|nr:hypothetical protein [Polyangiaceae bacterium]